MDRKLAMINAKASLRDYLHMKGWTQGGDCPICGHRGCFSVEPDGYHWHCFSAKHEGKPGGDIFDLYASMNGLHDGNAAEVIEAVYKELGLVVDPPNSKKDEITRREEAKKMAEIKEAAEAAKIDREAEAARLAEERRLFILKAAENIEQGKSYLDRRGISIETAKEYGLGYVEEWRSPAALRKGKAPPITPRLIIPNDEGGYLARDTRKEMPSGSDGYAKQKEGPASVFGLARLAADSGSPVFVVEGEIDALSIIEAGGRAVALGSASFVKKFVEWLSLKRSEAKGFKAPLILALDDDEAGRKATGELTEKLNEGGFRCSVADTKSLYGGLKDANEALVADREGLSRRLFSILQAESEAADIEALRVEAEYRQEHSAAAFMGGFETMLDTERKTISTGFPSLDKAVSGWEQGGLPVGLYVMGAISSLGKTTFMLQMADQMAEDGNDVLIFSLEMSRLELMGKSISRLIIKDGLERGLRGRELTSTCYTWAEIRDMAKRIALGKFDLKNKARVKEAADKYLSSIGSRVFIEEGGLNGTGMETIEAAVRRHRERTGSSPVVFIDYLQVLAAPKHLETATDKTITDYKIRALKVLSRDYDTPVIVISSFNRESYFKPVSITSFKESGLIEYSADVILGLQYKGMDDCGGKDDEQRARKIVDEAKTKPPEEARAIEVKILKNRSGGMTDTPLFSFHAPYNFFKEAEAVARRF